MNPAARLRDTRGMTLIELLVATVIVLVVLGVALGFFNTQGRMLRAGTGQFALTQNYRLALGTLASQVRAAGSNTAPGQPFLVYAGPDAVALNADFVSRDPNEPFAVSVDTAAPPGEVEALRRGDRFTLPGTSFAYPDTSYRMGAVNSGAETLIFFFTPDTTTVRADDFVLMRQVNAGQPAVVARNLLRTPGLPFLEYLYPRDSVGATQTIARFSGIVLTHAAPVHGRRDGVAPDTGAAARIDLVRGVRVNLTATDGTVDARERRRSVSRTILLPNAGVAALESCGEPPQMGSALTATPSAPGFPPQVTLAWNAATDERAGEQDVLRYVIWKRERGAADWGPPYVSVPSGNANYVYMDTQVQPARIYDYAIVAQDCTPSISPQTFASATLP
ncbi:MAG TPA: prepilin-type N-terminal cleavage/methylation domain-containing protein [Longimicrobium sp.]|nr:prepilin-type N-terminal cleavage/methylation domain-containing protein [Longimicrobium sp.]